nr:hypothetical protein [Tanacetum cinerariifolium]
MKVYDKKHRKWMKNEDNTDSYETLQRNPYDSGTMMGVDINTLTMEQYLALVSQDAILLCVFSFTLVGSDKRWVDRLTSGAVNTRDLLKKAFIQRNISSSGNNDRLVAVISKLDNLGCDTKKLNENVLKSNLDVKSVKDLTLTKDVLLMRKLNRTTNGAPSSYSEQCKVVIADHETPHRPISLSASINGA